ncbi:MAG: ABC transporter permease [Solirubrobacterales bacterium]
MESASLPLRGPAWRRRAASASDAFFGALGVLSFIALWYIGSRTTEFVPPIGEVVDAVPSFLTEEQIWPDISASLARVVGALAVASVVGFGAAYLMARGRFWGLVAARYVDLTLGLPSTIAALLALFIFKRSEVGVFVVVAIATFPFIALTLRQGFLAADRQLGDMASVYRFGAARQLRNVSIPHLVPYSLAAIRNEYAHAWRVVVLAELFAVNSGIGWRFSQAFDRFLLVEVALWLLTFMVVLLGTEYLVLRPIERWALRWRGGHT